MMRIEDRVLITELVAALKLALKCIAYCRKSHKDAQSDSGGIPVEVFLEELVCKAEVRLHV
jgi:hypothetical protein